MVRLVVYLLFVAVVASALAWLADRPGTLEIVWQGYTIQTSVFQAAVILSALIATGIFLWSLLRTIWNSPAIIGDKIQSKRRKKGLDALSSGMIAIGAGDGAMATRYALQARKSLPHEPLTQLLRAQAAQLTGDRATARRIYESMLSSPETEQLGLRGLFLEAEREGAGEAALQFAERAVRSNPQLGWCANALFDLQCREKDWAAALETLSQQKRTSTIAKPEMERRRAVLLTAQARDLEDTTPDKALTLASEAHGLAPDLVPAAVIAGRILASRGQTAKAAKILQKTWTKSPHPDIAEVYAYARIGDSTRDRFERVRKLAALNPHSIESPIAVASAAIDAQLFSEARKALSHLLDNGLTQRVATLMAKVEAGETGDRGKVRGWLARAVNAARDPVWMADGAISERWEPISPVTGKLDAFSWRVPVGTRDLALVDVEANRIEELLAIASSSAAAGSAAVSTHDERERSEASAATTALDNRETAASPPVTSPLIAADVEDAEAVTVRPAKPSAAAVGPSVPANDGVSPSTTATRPADEARVQPMAAKTDAPASNVEPTEASAIPAAPVSAAGDKPASDKSQKSAKSSSDYAAEKTPSTRASKSDSATTEKPVPVRPDYSAAETRKPAELEPKLFVAPRAPDDPGPDIGDDETLVVKPFRAANS